MYLDLAAPPYRLSTVISVNTSCRDSFWGTITASDLAGALSQLRALGYLNHMSNNDVWSLAMITVYTIGAPVCGRLSKSHPEEEGTPLHILHRMHLLINNLRYRSKPGNSD